MARYIDADALIGSITKRYEYDFGRASYVLEEIENAPTTDVVEVVRCRDCIHAEEKVLGGVSCKNVIGSLIEDDFFCAYGERRDDGEIH